MSKLYNGNISSLMLKQKFCNVIILYGSGSLNGALGIVLFEKYIDLINKNNKNDDKTIRDYFPIGSSQKDGQTKNNKLYLVGSSIGSICNSYLLDKLYLNISKSYDINFKNNLENMYKKYTEGSTTLLGYRTTGGEEIIKTFTDSFWLNKYYLYLKTIINIISNGSLGSSKSLKNDIIDLIVDNDIVEWSNKNNISYVINTTCQNTYSTICFSNSEPRNIDDPNSTYNYFNYQINKDNNWKDICLASSSLSLLFPSVKLLTNHNDTTKQYNYTDGGLLEQIPISYVLDDFKKTNGDTSDNLLILFDCYNPLSKTNNEDFQNNNILDYILNTIDITMAEVYFKDFISIGKFETSISEDQKTDYSIIYFINLDQKSYELNNTMRYINKEYLKVNISTIYYFYLDGSYKVSSLLDNVQNSIDYVDNQIPLGKAYGELLYDILNPN